MPPKRSTAAVDRRLGVLRAGDVELDDEQVVGVADRLRDGVGVAAGGDDVVAGGQRGLGEVDAHAAAGAGDEPGLVLGHGHQQSADRAEVGVPLDPGTGSTSQRRIGLIYPRCRGPPQRDPRVPHLAPGEDHAAAGRPARLRRHPARPRAAPRGGGDARRRERRLLHEDGARQPARRLRERARSARPRAAARRGRARAPVRPRPRRRADAAPAPPSREAAACGRACSASSTR